MGEFIKDLAQRISDWYITTIRKYIRTRKESFENIRDMFTQDPFRDYYADLSYNPSFWERCGDALIELIDSGEENSSEQEAMRRRFDRVAEKYT